MFYKTEDVYAMFNLLNVHGINYILTKNISKDMPARLQFKKDIDIIVHLKDYERYKSLMYSSSYVFNGSGKLEGFKFLYGSHENISLRHSTNFLIVDAYAELCAKSISMKAWVPLDKIIQKSIWEDKVWDADNQWWIMDDENMVIYLLTRSVFDKNGFSEAYIHEIEKRKGLLTNPTARQKLEKIFFKFSDTLIEKVNGGRYGEILLSYLTFTNY